ERLDRRLGTDFLRGGWAGVGIARALAPSRFHAVRTVAAGVLLGTNRWKRPVRLLLSAGGRPVPFVVPDLPALKVLAEVFVLDQYEDVWPGEPRAIVDLGAHVGASALFLRGRYPDARIVCVEASPALLPILRHNTAALGVEVRHAAVAARSGTVTFYESPQSWTGSLARSAIADSPVSVPTVTLDALLLDDVDLVKMDIEGSEFEIVPAATRLDQPAAYMGEIHAPPDDPRTAEFLAAFEGYLTVTEDYGASTLFRATRADPARRRP
ncbi:MAG TPA: FkbM family methyltransferase, partial [Thermoleophilaceae bacterium]|nr:FkbM family methyltransferase [Thermoleophilaceae bacterium]